MKHPNLFKFATSELSQDAFICWLLSWASPECKEIDSRLHKCGISLVKSLFEKHRSKNKTIPDSIETIEVIKQDSFIDVLCIVNGEYVILIEDKTQTKNSPGQLTKYLSEIKKREFEENKIFPIYFKTYDQSCYSDVKKKGYQVFSRSDFLMILNAGIKNGIENNILCDFRDHLQLISDKVESYSTLPIHEWHWHSWIGFYLRLQKELKTGNWDYVPNKNGGFLGFWWGGQGTPTCRRYLQLEEKKLCIKISVQDKSESAAQRSVHRNKYYKAINQVAKTIKLNKPERFGNGKTMTIVTLDEDDDYRIVNDNSVIDIGRTVENLEKFEKVLSVTY